MFPDFNGNTIDPDSVIWNMSQIGVAQSITQGALNQGFIGQPSSDSFSSWINSHKSLVYGVVGAMVILALVSGGSGRSRRR